MDRRRGTLLAVMLVAVAGAGGCGDSAKNGTTQRLPTQPGKTATLPGAARTVSCLQAAGLTKVYVGQARRDAEFDITAFDARGKTVLLAYALTSPADAKAFQRGLSSDPAYYPTKDVVGRFAALYGPGLGAAEKQGIAACLKQS